MQEQSGKRQASWTAARWLSRLLVAIAFIVQGCAYTVQAEEEEPVAAQNYTAWGQSRVIQTTEFEEGKRFTVLQHDPPTDRHGRPLPGNLVNTLMLEAELLGETGLSGLPNQQLMWELQFGQGGTRVAYEIDAAGAQQITVPAPAYQVAIFSKRAFADQAYAAPSFPLAASVQAAEGNTSTRAATLTEWYNLSDGSTSTTKVPKGATAVRLAGSELAIVAEGPFVAGVRFQILGATAAPGTANDEWTGDQLVDAHRQGTFLPIPGGTNRVAVENSVGNRIEYGLVYQIEF